MYQFEKLRVYQHALDLVVEIYTLTALLPKEEKFALIDQLKRASVSIVLNIAEGCVGWKGKDTVRFLRIALGSLYEVVAAFQITQKIFKTKVDLHIQMCDLVGKELNSLIKSLETRNEKQITNSGE